MFAVNVHESKVTDECTCFSLFVFTNKSPPPSKKGDEAEQYSHGIIQSLYTSLQKKEEKKERSKNTTRT